MYFANYEVSRYSKPFISYSIDDIPECKTALVLGTSKYLRKGTKNDFFFHRIHAAVYLFKRGKVKFLILSGDNSKEYYNEPALMRKELLRYGIPDSVMFADYAGFRTFDSMVRAKEIFGQNKFIVVSQRFHNERAIFIGREKGMEVYGFNAPDVAEYKQFKTLFREFFARTKVILDIILGTEPKFLGEKVLIP
jgi:SanA protein